MQLSREGGDMKAKSKNAVFTFIKNKTTQISAFQIVSKY